MTSERIKEIQEQTAYPESVSVMLALKQVWNECAQEQLSIQRVSLMLPIKAKHKLFGYVEIIGIRTECDSNNNKMYMLKNEGEYFWVYDYETELIGN